MESEFKLRPGPVLVRHSKSGLQLAWYSFQAQRLLMCQRNMVVLYFGRSSDDFYRVRKSRIIPLNLPESIFYKELHEMIQAVNKLEGEISRMRDELELFETRH